MDATRPTVEDLQAHIADAYGFHAKAAFSFEDDVILLRDGSDRRWVARVFPRERPLGAVRGDAAILAWLEAHDYPAERRIGEDCVTVMDGRPVLVTRAVAMVPRAQRRQTIKDAGGIRGLGALLGWLHTMEADDAAVQRPGGAWHHMTEGPPSAELACAAAWLDSARERAPVRELAHYDALEDALAGMSDCSDLPHCLLHPDFVLANVVATPGPGMILVDWAGAGRGPRLWPLAFLLWAEGAKDLRRIDLAVSGYRREVTLTAGELERLGAVVGARHLVFEIWHVFQGDRAASEAAVRVSENAQLSAAIAERARAAFLA